MIEKLLASPNPDLEKIAALKAQLAAIDETFTEYSDTLRALEDEYSFVGCGV